MKKLFVILMFVFFSCSCSLIQEPTMETIEPTASDIFTANSSEDINITSSEEDILFNDNISVESTVERIFQILNNQNITDWVGYTGFYPENNAGYLFNVDFESYKILSISKDNIKGIPLNNVLVEFIVSTSNDLRFPVGTSFWNLGISQENNGLIYFLPECENVNSIYCPSECFESKADIAYLFSHAFMFYESIDDMNNLPAIVNKKADELNGEYSYRFLCGVQTFIFPFGLKANPSFDEVNQLLFDYLGIHDYCWREDKYYEPEYGISGEYWKGWSDSSCRIIINTETNEYIDMTYYADNIYLVPAKKMRYFFRNNGKNLQLISVKLLEDYGTEPNEEPF